MKLSVLKRPGKRLFIHPWLKAKKYFGNKIINTKVQQPIYIKGSALFCHFSCKRDLLEHRMSISVVCVKDDLNAVSSDFLKGKKGQLKRILYEEPRAAPKFSIFDPSTTADVDATLSPNW